MKTLTATLLASFATLAIHSSASAMPIDCKVDTESHMEACMQKQVNAGYCKHIEADEAHSYWTKGKANKTKGSFGACEWDDPSQIVRQALLPLFEHKKGANQNEIRFFTPTLKKLAYDYFAIDDNARDFDADWLLGMQDWSGITPTFSTIIIDVNHAKVIVSFTLPQGDAGQNVYIVIFDGKHWAIDDIIYSDKKSLRDLIAFDNRP
jgi:hypothetical protein